MNAEYEKRLEAEMDRTLKGLPELEAPRTLGPRVLAALERRMALPWYRLPWQSWPVGLRAISMVFLLASFGGLCAAAWQLTQLTGVDAVVQEIEGWWLGVREVFHILDLLLDALLLAVRHLGAGVMIACFGAVAVGYAMCLALGTLYLRLAFARR